MDPLLCDPSLVAEKQAREFIVVLVREFIDFSI
jgi:hypothetical protein